MKDFDKKAQVSMEYLIIVAFVTFVVIAVLGIAFFYSGIIKDKLRETQISNYAHNIISASESVFYSGEPSKATISAYLPDNVLEITVTERDLVVEFQTSSGVNKIAFPSNVNITGGSPLSVSQGLKKIEIVADANHAIINQA
jgi:uncharacterized protein (UPF0333 family)